MMTIAELTEWGREMIRDAARQRDFAMGVLAVAAGSFDESACAPAGFVDESDLCAGGREAIQRMTEPAPVGRVSHGTVVDGESWSTLGRKHF